MTTYLICYLLEKYGFEDISRIVFERLKSNSKIPTKIKYDGSEAHLSYEDLLSTVPKNICKMVAVFFSFFERFRYHDKSVLSIEKLILNKESFFKLTENFNKEISKYSYISDNIKNICFKNTFLSVRNLKSGIYDFDLTQSLIGQSHYFNKFVKHFVSVCSIYSHQHIDDSEFGLGGEPASVYLMKKDKTGNVLISGGDDGIIRLWNTYTGNLLLSIRKHTGDIIDIDINSCNCLLASCCGKGQLFLTLIIGNEWLPIAIIENTDRLTYVRFAYSKLNFITKEDEIFKETELLISAGDNAMIFIYKVADLFMHGASHYMSLIRQKEWVDDSLSKFHQIFKSYDILNSLISNNLERNSLFYRSPPLYKIDIFPLSPRAFDICLKPSENNGYLMRDQQENHILFSVGASLQSRSSSEEIQIKITGIGIPAEILTIQKHSDKQGYSLVFIIPLTSQKVNSGISIIEMPQEHNDHPDVSFANNSHDLVTASDDGVIILWIFSKNCVHNKIKLNTYISEKINSDAYSKKKNISLVKTHNERSIDESASEDDSDYIANDSMDETSFLRRNPIRSSRFISKNKSLEKEDNKPIGSCNSNMVQFIDSIQWSCNDSMILIAQSVASKGALRRQRNVNFVHCIESCVSYFSRYTGTRISDIILPNTYSRIACLIPHPISSEIVLSLTYSGGIFVISNSKNNFLTKKFSNKSHILFEHQNNKNPYLNGTWLKDGLGFVVSQKYGCFEIFNACNNKDFNQQFMSQTYRFSFPEQLFLSDFSEILRDEIFGLIDPNIRKPIHMIPRSVIVDRNKRMYPEPLQPPMPKASSLGNIYYVDSTNSETSISNRMPLFLENVPEVFRNIEKNSNLELYLEGAKKRVMKREKLYKELFRSCLSNINQITSPVVQTTSSENIPEDLNGEFTWISSQNLNEYLNITEETQTLSNGSSNDEDFDLNRSNNSSITNRRLRRENQLLSDSELNSSSSSAESNIEDDENDYFSDLTSEDSLYNEIKGSNSISRSRRDNSNRRVIKDLDFDENGNPGDIEFRYYSISNLNIYWIPDSEELEKREEIICKLCGITNTTIIGYDYLIKSSIEFKVEVIRPILHGVNGSIDLGPLIGPFNYYYSTQKPHKNLFKSTDDDFIKENQFYLHARCLITIPYLYWEVVNDQIYTNLFDIMNRTYNPSSEISLLPKSGLSSTFFDINVVKFPKLIRNCSYCRKYGASILCQGNKCNRQFHYHCSSLIYHSFPESINSSYISPRESDFYWCDIMQFYLFYCPKCIQLKHSNVPYNPKRDEMIDNSQDNDCKRSWLLVDEISTNYNPQIKDYLYFFPNAYLSSGLDDLFFKSILTGESSYETNKKPLKRTNKKNEFIKCKLVHISYAFPNNSEQNMKVILTFLTKSNYGNDIYWQIRCSPNEGPDYLVLEDEVEKGIHNLKHRFRIGQENVIFIDDSWHEVIIRDIKTNAIWESIEVGWKNQETDDSMMVSPWEIHECIPDSKSVLRNLENEEDLLRIFNWIIGQKGVNNPLSIIEFFVYPIPFYSKKKVQLSSDYCNQEWVMHYWKEIPLPLSFVTIINRIKKNYYRKIESLIFDIFLVRSNCEHFNINNGHLIQGIRTIEYEILRLIFGKRLPRYITQLSVDISSFFEERDEFNSLGKSNSSNSDEDNLIVRSRKRRL